MATLTGQTEQGNCGPVQALGNGEYRCSPIPEAQYLRMGMTNQWFLWHAMARGERGERMTVHVDWPPFDREKLQAGCNSSDSFFDAVKDCVFISEDRIHWRRIEETRTEGWRLSVTAALPADTCYLAVNLYYTPARFADLRRALTTSPYIREQIIGTAWGGDPIHLFTATDTAVAQAQKQTVYLQGGQHACEYSGCYVLDYLLRFLASGLDEAAQLLRRYVFHVVPVLSASSWRLGMQEHISGKNPNRDWVDLELSEPQAVDRFLRALPQKPGLLLDLHNGWSTYEKDGSAITVMDDLPEPLLARQTALAQSLIEDCDYLAPEKIWHNSANPVIFKGYAQAHFGFGFTLEFSRYSMYDRALGRRTALSQERYARLAPQLARVIDRFVREQV